MAITKTNFINYIRCKRYVALDEIHKDKLLADVSFDEYQKEKQISKLQEILGTMFDEEDEDLIDVTNPQLEVMLPYYNEIEIIAGKQVEKTFKGKTFYSKNTLNQESFDFIEQGIRYLCYVDILNEQENITNIIEVKATTNKKFLSLGYTYEKEHKNIFVKQGSFLKLIEDIDPNYLNYHDKTKYDKQKAKLFDRYNSCGHYVYDLAVQRFIIENDLKKTNRENELSSYRYFLAVLNSDYIFDGIYENELPLYNKNKDNEELINFIDLTSVTALMQDKIARDKEKITNYLKKMDAEEVKLGPWCEYKKTTECKYTKTCFDKVLVPNSILNYTYSHHGFKKDNIKYDRFDLISDGFYTITSLPDEYLNRKENQIQKEVVKTNVAYENKNKIKKAIDTIIYPIYHLDFETFNCPIPRFKGEKPYQQSLFQFSLHIEKKPFSCDKIKDHYEFLATDHTDQRKKLLLKLIEYIDTSKPGTILVYNESFEKTRLKELAQLFPEYNKQINKMIEMLFDLYDVVKTNTKFYEDLGFSKEEAKLFNYYHPNLYGSFSIKKVLPLFSNLSYKDLVVANGMEAIVAYGSYPKLSEEKKLALQQNLRIYCRQDTWAMVEILWGLKKLVDSKELINA